MRNQLNLLLTFVCVTIGTIASSGVLAAEPPHPYHVSLAEVNWNPKSKKFEVALCLWPADLEKALAQQTGRPIDLAKEPEVDRLIEAYVAKHFMIHSTPKTAEQTKQQQPTAEPTSGNSSSRDVVELENSAATKKQDAAVAELAPAIQTVVITPAAVPQAQDTPAPSKIKWYGHEADAKQAWLYFEVFGDADANWTVENRVFFELNDDQLNHVQWKGTGKTETLVCDTDNAKISLGKK